MSTRLATIASILLVIGLGVAGCGSDSKPKTVTKTETKTVTSTPTTGKTAPEDETGKDDTAEVEKDPATIIPFMGIADAHLGDTATKVTGKMGPADKVQSQSSELGGPRKVYTYGNGAFVFQTIEGKVVQIETRNPGDRTATDVGPGSTLAAVKKAYPAASCDDGGGITLCRLDNGASVVTDFFVPSATGTVQRVVIGYVD